MLSDFKHIENTKTIHGKIGKGFNAELFTLDSSDIKALQNGELLLSVSFQSGQTIFLELKQSLWSK